MLIQDQESLTVSNNSIEQLLVSVDKDGWWLVKPDGSKYLGPYSSAIKARGALWKI